MASDRHNFEIDTSKLRHRIDDTIATSRTAVEEPNRYVWMEVLKDDATKPTDLSLQGSHLVSSMTSSLADTPGDSGVLCLDSETSEATSQALMSHSLIGAEELACDSQCDPIPVASQELTKSTNSSIMSRSDIDNQNLGALEDVVPELLVEVNKKSPICENLPDVVLKALESEKVVSPEQTPFQRMGEPKKSLSEDIVYRRRCRKKSQSGPSTQKKRVSFHEDILKNTKTDNIHIEHGFVSYRPDSGYCDRFKKRNNIMSDRFSWCASGDKAPKYAADVAQQTMSDILAYGDPKADNSGIFEYCQEQKPKNNEKKDNNDNDTVTQSKLYGCDSNSSDSNLSCESETTSTDSTSSNSNSSDNSPVTLSHRKCDKAQKSYSCDGFGDSGHMTFMRKTYFSEADIDQSHERNYKPLEVTESPSKVKSVLKKKRYITTNVVEEKKQNKVLNILDANNIIDSLKSFYKNFNFNFSTEKGVPEPDLDINSVVEALSCDVNENNKLSKSLDSGFQIEDDDDDDDDFVEINLNEPSVEPNRQDQPKAVDESNNVSPRHKLMLNMKSTANKNSDKTLVFPPVNKYVVNCESTVYEHKGVSYNYVHDTFQTAFNAPTQSFVPLPESGPSNEKLNVQKLDSSKQNDGDSSSKCSTPKRQFNKIVQEEADQKNGSRHLSSPKKQNVNRFGKRPSILKKQTEETTQGNSDNCSNTDNSTLKGADELNDEDFDNITNQKLITNKSALLSRYLKSVYQRNNLEHKIKKNKFYREKLRLEKGFPSIIYPMSKVSETFHSSAQRMSRLIDKEVIENKRLSVRLLTTDEPSYFDSFEDNVAIECSEKLRLQIFLYPFEALIRMLKVQSSYDVKDGSWSPLLVFITDFALYVATVKPEGTEYDLLCRLPHEELDAIAVGPESQYIQVIDIAGNIVCSIVTGDASLCARLVSSLEWSARTSRTPPARAPAVIQLTSRQLLVSVAKQRLEKRLPRVMFYGRACSGDSGDRGLDAPGAFAPPLEGYLMCRTEPKRKFEPYYFLLRAGVLHWGQQSPSTNGSLSHSVALRSVLGVRRYWDSSKRPHCFEIALADGSSLLLAASDDHAASAWLQSLLLHAAQALEEKEGVRMTDSLAGGPPTACSVLVTPHEVLSVRETLGPAFVAGAASYLRDRGLEDLLRDYIHAMRSDVEILACGSIKNLTAFKIPDSDENWCCLEWSVCEARERGAGIALVFASSAELERFITAVERAFCALTSEPFPLSVIDSSKSACGAAHSKYEAAWVHMLPAQQ